MANADRHDLKVKNVVVSTTDSADVLQEYADELNAQRDKDIKDGKEVGEPVIVLRSGKGGKF